MSRKWGKKINEKTLKHLFLKHFHFRGHDKWILNPDDKDNVQKRIIPTLRMVMSWGYKDIAHFTEQEIVGFFLGIIKWNHPEVYKEGMCH